MKRIQKYHHLLQAVRTADPKTRVAILRAAPDDFIKALIEIVLNFLGGNLKTSPSVVNRLRKHKCKIRRLASCKGNKGVVTARKQFVQKGGFISLLLPIITAAVLPKIAANTARSATNSVIDTAVERAQSAISKL